MRKGPLILGAALLLGGFAALLLPPLLRSERAPLAGTAAPQAVGGQEDVVRLEPSASACVQGVALSPRTKRIGFRIAGPDGPQPVGVSVFPEGTGYERRIRVDRGYGTAPTRVLVPIERPERESLGTVCLSNDGNKAVELSGTDKDNAEARAVTLVEGRDAMVDVELTLHEDDASVASRAGAVFDRIALFKPPWAPEWLLWVLALLVLAAVPFGALWPLWRALGEDEE